MTRCYRPRVCECGALVRCYGGFTRRAHENGGDHRAGVHNEALRAAGFVPLPGTTAATAAALERRGYDVRRWKVWRSGYIDKPGRYAYLAAVRREDLPDIAACDVVAAARGARAELGPLHGATLV